MTDPHDHDDRRRLRAGDADRQETIDALTRAWREGRIDREEFQDRVEDAMSETYLDELAELLEDIGGLPTQSATGYPGPPVEVYNANANSIEIRDSWQADDHHENLPVLYAPEGSRGSGLSVGFMGGMDKTGEWIVAPHHVSIGVMGGTTVDLRDAIFVSPETTITCIGFWGGVEVIVPPEMDVRVTGIGFMGGFGWDKRRYAKPSRTPTPGNPRVTINGLGLMGGVGIVRKARNAPLDDDD